MAQAGLSWWSVISPFSGYGSTAALVFVLAVAAVKAIWEDVKRHHEDNRMNTSITHRVEPDGEHQLWQAAGWNQLGVATSGRCLVPPPRHSCGTVPACQKPLLMG